MSRRPVDATGTPTVPHAQAVSACFERLASLGGELEQSADGLIAAVLELLAESLEVGLTFLSRVEGASLHIVRAYDRTGMGMRTGDEIALCDTY